MQFVPLENMKVILRRNSDNTTSDQNSPFNITDKNGSLYRLYSANTSYTYVNRSPFLCSLNSSWSSASDSRVYVYASTDENISASAYAPTETVGSCICSVVSNMNKGWIMTIKVTGNEIKTIKSLYFSRKLYYSSNTSTEALLWAVKLDTPVELNESNNYTANFTFAVEF